MAPTQLDRTMQSRNVFIGFAGLVTAVSVWMIWGQGDMFPKKKPAKEPTGEPTTWSEDELRKYLTERNLAVGKNPTHQELVAMVIAKKEAPQ
ncbi:hypothetical protein B9Z65_2586 [Elsinoe australis]|uniref:Uncharacterized protein n=1 Tax=Elsinoe australis TaxID=40998 RepID=A0A2P8A402_9PEZI|nr:hypothetical protein B9Z65_2586 [Elsinoe australis]